MEKVGFGIKLKGLLSEVSFNQKELAKRIGVNPRTISVWKHYTGIKKKPRGDNIAKLSDVFKVSVPYLLDNTKSYPPINGDRLPKKSILIPRGGVIKEVEGLTTPIITKVAADGSINIAYDDAGYPVGEGLYQVERPPGLKGEYPYGAEVAGDSMEPGLPDKSVVFVDPTSRAEWDKVRSGQVVICRLVDGRSFVKQFKIIDGQMMLFSSKNYDPIPIRKEIVDVLHKVVWVKMP